MTLRKLGDVVLFKDDRYLSFPNVIRKPDGELLLAFRRAPDWQATFGHYTHVDPGSEAVVAVSADGGGTWSGMRTLHDDYLYGVQDPCLNVLGDGTIAATFFKWKVYDAGDIRGRRPSDHLVYGRWVGRFVGTFTSRSRDGGLTWDEPAPMGIEGAAVRGNAAELPDGSIVVVAYRMDPDHRLIVAKSHDQGRTWTHHATIAGSGEFDLDETNVYRTDSGKLVAFIRTLDHDAATPKERRSPLFVAESFDDGDTWSTPKRTGLYTPSPFHAIRLQSGRVLLTYGYRVAPYGLRARLLEPECGNVDEAEEVVLRDDGLGTDIGYSHAVQLPDGRILIVYYYYDEPKGVRYIAGTWCEEA
ncbi:MAG: exo-alpha-sialidase [Paenibacillaceae bacterium]|nr:exo-alpha-sialidase [Paenibacillaceae bacterium]